MNPTDPYAFPWSQAITVLRAGLAEDVAGGDLTTNLLFDETSRARGVFRAKASGVIAGLPGSLHVFRLLNDTCTVHAHVQDGTRVTRGDVIAEVEGPTRAVLTGERLALNLLQRLSGIATLTRQCADALAGSAATLLDTRKTTPGLRALEKAAVVSGGGCSHRAGLFDAFLAKDNHLAGVSLERLAGVVQQAVVRARRLAPLAFTMVEVDTEAQFVALLSLPRGVVDAVLLDNMSPARMKRIVALRDRCVPWLKLEASGGVTVSSVPAIARSGVDFISAGSITHSAPQIDFGLDIVDA